MRLLLTGGHLTPAISLLQYLRTTKHEAVLIGRTRTNHHPGSFSQEESAVKALGFGFEPLDSPKFNRYQPLRSAFQLPLIFKTYRQALKIIQSVQPDAVLCFGGYLSVPVAMAAYRLRLPIIIHEQTATAGLANEFIARFATRVVLSYPMSRRYFPPSKTVVIGNLLRQEMYAVNLPAPEFIKPNPKKPLLYVTGGNQGSLTINRLIGSLYQPLLKDYFIIHQTGQINESGSYGTMVDLYRQLPQSLQSQLVIKPWFNNQDTAWIFQHAHIMVGRSGANTLSELILHSLPSILLPLPKTYHNEQLVHARLLAGCQGSQLIINSPPTPDEFVQAINHLETQYSQAVLGLRGLKKYLNPNATKEITDLIHHLLK